MDTRFNVFVLAGEIREISNGNPRFLLGQENFLYSSEKEISEGWWKRFIFNTVETKMHLFLLRCLFFDKHANIQWPKSRKLKIDSSKISKVFPYKSHEGVYVKLRFLGPTLQNSDSIHLGQGPGLCPCTKWL